MRVVALKAWSNGFTSMEEKGVYDVNDEIAQELIAQGLCADAATYFGGDYSSEPFYVNVNSYPESITTTHEEVLAAHAAGKKFFAIVDHSIIAEMVYQEISAENWGYYVNVAVVNDAEITALRIACNYIMNVVTKKGTVSYDE